MGGRARREGSEAAGTVRTFQEEALSTVEPAWVELFHA
jgi:hypothetical protein